LVALTLGNAMRVTQLTLQFEVPPDEIDDINPSNMMIEGTTIEPEIEVQSGR
jgi:hypothetical protein